MRAEMPKWTPLGPLSCPGIVSAPTHWVTWGLSLGLSFLLFKRREQDFTASQCLLVLKGDKENFCADVSHFSIQHRGGGQ